MAGCVNPSKSDAGLSPKSRTGRFPVMLPPCRICSEIASGFHYGANTCEACKGFFKRSLKKKAPYICAYDYKCDTRASKRTLCNACRFRKCTVVGMSKSAIKTGRYTHEKKTKIIKEVKQLELARQAALPTKPSSNNVVALSKLPQQITDNKYELVDNKYEFVIEQILAAYREHPLLEVNFLADMKQKEETYLEERRLHDFMFGPTKPVTTEDHIEIYRSTGIDVDGRIEHMAHMLPLFENCARRSIAFIKALPGFKSLPVDDKISLLKKSRLEICIILGHKNVNYQHRMVTLFWGETLGADTLTIMHSEELVEAMFSLSIRFQKLDLSQTETIILSCIALFFPDRCKLKCPEKVEKIQHLMMETLSYFLKRMYPDKPHLLAMCLLLLPEVRSFASMLARDKEHFLRMWCDMLTFPPLLCELCQQD